MNESLAVVNHITAPVTSSCESLGLCESSSSNYHMWENLHKPDSSPVNVSWKAKTYFTLVCCLGGWVMELHWTIFERQ